MDTPHKSAICLALGLGWPELYKVALDKKKKKKKNKKGKSYLMHSACLTA